MRYKFLSEFCDLNMGQSPDSSTYNNQGEGLPFYQGNADFGIIHPKTRVWCSDPVKRAHANDILISVRAPIGAMNIATEECCIGRGLAALTPKQDVCSQKYLYYALESCVDLLMSKGTGSTFKAISKKTLEETAIPVYSLEEQEEITCLIGKTDVLIEARKKQLLELDILVKSRFVELFGDPVRNSKCLPVLPMTEVCEITDGDRGKNYPKQEEFFEDEYCLFLNAKNVTSQGFNFSERMFITKEKDEVLRKGKLNRGDVVLTTRGTLGNIAFYTEDVPFENVRINSGMVILRMNRSIIDEGFFIEQFRMQVDDIKKTVASGSAQPQLPISTMNKISVIMPDLNVQREFSGFVTQVDKSKYYSRKCIKACQRIAAILKQEWMLFLYKGISGDA